MQTAAPTYSVFDKNLWQHLRGHSVRFIFMPTKTIIFRVKNVSLHKVGYRCCKLWSFTHWLLRTPRPSFWLITCEWRVSWWITRCCKPLWLTSLLAGKGWIQNEGKVNTKIFLLSTPHWPRILSSEFPPASGVMRVRTTHPQWSFISTELRALHVVTKLFHFPSRF